MRIGTTALLLLFAAPAGAAEITRYTLPPAAGGKPARILESVEVPATAATLYVSGQVAAPLDPAKPIGPGLTAADMGDTRAQTASALAKVKAILEKHGYRMADIIKMTVFLAPDPRLGRMDFDGMNAAFDQVFNTAAVPVTLARSAVQVGALANPALLVEVEVTAARMR